MGEFLKTTLPDADATETHSAGTNALVDVVSAEEVHSQAIMNGGFDIFQRWPSIGSAKTNPATNTCVADRWLVQFGVDGGTPPTINHSQERLTAGAVANCGMHYNVNVNGAGASYGANSFYLLFQRIERGTRSLASGARKVTLSFWASSTIANKRLGVGIEQNYGTGGSPTSAEKVKSNDDSGLITLTSTLTQYFVHFTLNTLSGKSFGTSEDDNLAVLFFLQWGATVGGNYIKTGVSAESFVGTGDIKITGVRLCVGAKGMDYVPQNFGKELEQCQRFYEKSYDYSEALGASDADPAVLTQVGGTAVERQICYPFRKRKRGAPVLTLYDTSGNSGKISYKASWGSGWTANVSPTGSHVDEQGLNFYLTTANCGLGAHFTADSEYTG